LEDDPRMTISVIVPCYNESEVLPEFMARLSDVIEILNLETFVLFVNDGSTDETLKVLHGIATDFHFVGVLNLTRNFGKEAAMTAGLDHAPGDAVVVIDADLQDPPEVIPLLVAKWREGHDIVYAQRRAREGETFLKRSTASLFYRVMRRSSRIDLPVDTGDFRLLSRRAVDNLLQLRERHRFMKGLFAWVGYDQAAVIYDRAPRQAGKTKWNYWRLWNFAVEGITSFSTVPLTLATYAGLLLALCSGAYGCFIVAITLVKGGDVPGYPSLLVTILFLGGTQLLTLGILGEYVGRIFNEVKQRPLYLIERFTPPRQRMRGGDKCDRP
jgi:glycosyltransferase involved in cell wall biosynthesis